MGGVFNDIREWMGHYGIEDEKALLQWINDSAAMMKNPFNTEYMIRTKVESTWPACMAVKVAELQGRELAERFYRKLMETIQVRAENGSLETVLEKTARESALEIPRFVSDLRGEKPLQMLREDRRHMKTNEGNFYSLLITNTKTGERKIVNGYTSEKYERAIDELAGQGLQKKDPIDILEYMDRRRGFLISAREIAEVFKIDDNEAERRLNGLSVTGAIKQFDLADAGSYWSFPEDANIPKLTLEQVELSHVTARSKVAEEADLEKVVTTAVQGLYTQVAENPTKQYHFPLGRDAALFVGYPREELDAIPEKAVESFAGVGYPHAAQVIGKGDTVLDVGSGSGTDILVAALRAGKEGKVYGLDFTDAMIAKAERNIAESGFKNVRILRGNATRIPLEDNFVDVVTSNGVLNLVPEKHKAFEEIFRVLRPSGRLQLADIVVQEDVQKACGLVPQLWADCIGGAAVEKSYLDTIKSAGFVDVRVISRLDYFSRSSSDSTKRLTKTFGAESIVVSARKPG